MLKFLDFAREKFDLVVVAALFLLVFVAFKSGDFDPETQKTMRDLLLAFSGALLGAIGASRRGTQNNFEADTIQARNISRADTQSGDIIAGNIEGVKKNETDP
jgi:hypothetical protein